MRGRESQKRYLSLRLFRPTGATLIRPDRPHGRPIAHDEQAPKLWSHSVESLIEDPWQTDPNFFSLRFLRSTFEKSEYNVVQVFSYYGIIGYRVFNLDESTGIYSLGGQVPYLGQPAETTGLGVQAQWGASIIPYANTPNWLDEAYFTPDNDGTSTLRGYTSGHWGMNVSDEKRAWIHRTDVHKRPNFSGF